MNLDYINLMYNGKVKKTGFFKHYYLLYSIVNGLETTKSFEFGTGISTSIILEASKPYNGLHYSCDIRNINNTGLNQQFINENINRWTFLQSSSSLINFSTYGPFDFVLHDGSHEKNEVYNDLLLVVKSMKRNSILMVHDTLLTNCNLNEAVSEVCSTFKNEKITLDYSYGLTIIKVLEDFGNGIINPEWSK